MTPDQIRDRIRGMLSERRYTHSLGVEELCVRLGVPRGFKEERLRTAALLHDIGKSMPSEELVHFADRHSLFLTEDDRKARGVIHAIAGEFLARENFGVQDEEILKSIRYHTTGSGNMSPFQKVLFVSDYLDPNRGFEENGDLAKLALDRFEDCVMEVILRKMAYVMKKGDHLHPLSVKFYNSQLLAVRDSR